MLQDNLKKYREEKKLSQSELAARVHVVRQTISKWESGLSVPDAEMLLSLSDALGVTPAMLLGTGEAPASDRSAEKSLPETVADLSEKLAALTAMLAEKAERRRRFLRILGGIGVGIAVLFLLLQFVFGLCVKMVVEQSESTSVGIIGGADGPTAILVARQSGVDPSWILLTASILIAGLVLLWLSRKKSK